MKTANIKIIAGLGNPGPQYEATRHNVGFWLVDEIAKSCGEVFIKESRFNAELCRVFFNGKDIRLIKPQTFMNCSGQPVGEVARYFKVDPSEILVVHDDLDLLPGASKLKCGGGHGGHNGLRDIVAHLNSKDFFRLRIGIGHPGDSKKVTNYVLGAPGRDDAIDIDRSIGDCIDSLSTLFDQGLEKAMHKLHSN